MPGGLSYRGKQDCDRRGHSTILSLYLASFSRSDGAHIVISVAREATKRESSRKRYNRYDIPDDTPSIPNLTSVEGDSIADIERGENRCRGDEQSVLCKHSPGTYSGVGHQHTIAPIASIERVSAHVPSPITESKISWVRVEGFAGIVEITLRYHIIGGRV